MPLNSSGCRPLQDEAQSWGGRQRVENVERKSEVHIITNETPANEHKDEVQAFARRRQPQQRRSTLTHGRACLCDCVP
jgi:hypothetical protein